MTLPWLGGTGFLKSFHGKANARMKQMNRSSYGKSGAPITLASMLKLKPKKLTTPL